MAKLNSNLVLCNVSVNDNVVAARMGIGSQRGYWQTTASLPLGLPAPSGIEPTFASREASALVESDDYRDARRERAGRSEISPNAGGTVLPHRCPGHARTAINKRWQFAKQQGFMKSQMLLANATRATRDLK